MRKKREEEYVTIKTVAKEAKVSTATVSRVINGGRVKEEKKRQVLDAIKKLNYTPNNSARNLASVRTTKRIGLVIPSLTPSYIDMIQGFKMGLKIYKYEALIEEFENNRDMYDEISDIQERSSEIKGIIQFAHKKELQNKFIFSVLDDNIKSIVPGEYDDCSIAIYIPEDEFLQEFYLNKIFKSSEIYIEGKEYDIVIVEKIDQALELHNFGYKGKIKIIERTNNIHKIFPNMSMLNVDMYKFGIFLSRYMIKKMTDVETDEMEIVIDEERYE